MQLSILRKWFPYAIAYLAAFYLIPMVALYLPLQASVFMAVISALFVNSVISFVTGMFYTLRRGFSWYFPLITGAFFLPANFIFYNGMAFTYLFAYVVLALCGCLLGKLILRIKQMNH